MRRQEKREGHSIRTEDSGVLRTNDVRISDSPIRSAGRGYFLAFRQDAVNGWSLH